MTLEESIINKIDKFVPIKNNDYKELNNLLKKWYYTVIKDTDITLDRFSLQLEDLLEISNKDVIEANKIVIEAISRKYYYLKRCWEFFIKNKSSKKSNVRISDTPIIDDNTPVDHYDLNYYEDDDNTPVNHYA